MPSKPSTKSTAAAASSTAVESDRIWMACSCGAVLVRVVAFG
jgi:hypothetical protein